MMNKEDSSQKYQGVKTIFSTIWKNWSALLCFEMFFRGFGFLFLFPFLRYLLSLLPRLTGEAYLGQRNIFLICHHPAAVLLLIGILLTAGLFIYFEIAALFLYSEKSWRREQITTRKLWKETGSKAVRLLSPKCLPAFLFLPVMILSVFSMISGYLQNIQIPEFVMEFMESNLWLFVLFIVLVLFFHYLLFLYMFGFPSLLFRNQSFLGSWRESRELLKKKKLRTAGKMAAYVLWFYLAMAFLTAAGILILAGGVRLFTPLQDARAQFEFYYLSLQSIWGIVSGALTSVFFCSVIVTFYHRMRGEDRPAESKKTPTLRHAVIRTAAVLGTLVLLILFSESEIGGDTEYLEDIPTQIVAHRAGAAFAPENTVAALHQAAEDGAYMAEIDVQQLADGTLAVLHDTNFKRTTGVDLNVWDAGYETVKQLDTGASFSEAFAGEPVPRLEDMLLAAKDRIFLMIELKATGHEDHLVEQTLSLIKKYGMEDQCMVASMDMELLKESKRLNPDIPTVYISFLLFTEDYDLKDLDAYSVETTSLTYGLVVQAHLQGKQVYAWTANSEDTINKILRCEADGLITDNPLLAQYCISQANETPLMDWLCDLFFPPSDRP